MTRAGSREGIDLPLADPWHDYLAIPIAPLILLLQLASLFASNRTVRWTIGLSSFAALVVMFVYVDSIDPAPDEGANIGAGVLLFWILCSLGLLALAALREVIGGLRRLRSRRPPG